MYKDPYVHHVGVFSLWSESQDDCFDQEWLRHWMPSKFYNIDVLK